MNPLSFRLDVFEGPLDLLLHLIAKNKVNIYDIPISLIFEQYMEQIDIMQSLDMEIAGEFISMAAELMLIKSRMLLPHREEEQEDPRASLAAALIEYKRAKNAAEKLSFMYSRFGTRMVKDRDEVDCDLSIPDGQDVIGLFEAFGRISRRRKLYESSLNETQSDAIHEIAIKKVRPIHEKIFGILRFLLNNGPTDIDTLLMTSQDRSDLIAAFMSVLQLIARNQLILKKGPSDSCPVLVINHDRHKSNIPVESDGRSE